MKGFLCASRGQRKPCVFAGGCKQRANINVDLDIWSGVLVLN